MKIRKTWRWTLTYPDGTGGWGFCPAWASQPLPATATLTRERVLALGDLQPCNFCRQSHVAVPHP